MKDMENINYLKGVLEDLDTNATVSKNSDNAVRATNGLTGLDIALVINRNNATAPRRAAMPTNSAKANTILRVTGWSNGQNKMNQKLMDAFKAHGCKEATNYGHTEWGAWRIEIDSDEEFFRVLYIAANVIDGVE